jgi:hypothetical protein
MNQPVTTPTAAIAATAATSAPGRSCPLHYRYTPEVFAVEAPERLRALDVLYVVGGLYGNPLALERVLQLFASERGRKRLVFNGDFHWFDADAAMFAQVQQAVLSHEATRGNVETELVAQAMAGDADAGCGCAYPEWVGDGVVERSNRILARLRQHATPAQRAQLSALPMWQRADVGGVRVGIVHGDATSLAGWGFAQEHLSDATHRAVIADWLDRAQVEVFACTHTCLPVFQALDGARRWVLNNGAAGMPNFRGDGAGLLTRIALQPYQGPERRFGVAVGQGVHADAIAIDVDPVAWRTRFEAMWPPGSDAQVSYADRIRLGPDYRPEQALRLRG